MKRMVGIFICHLCTCAVYRDGPSEGVESVCSSPRRRPKKSDDGPIPGINHLHVGPSTHDSGTPIKSCTQGLGPALRTEKEAGEEASEERRGRCYANPFPDSSSAQQTGQVGLMIMIVMDDVDARARSGELCSNPTTGCHHDG